MVDPKRTRRCGARRTARVAWLLLIGAAAGCTSVAAGGLLDFEVVTEPGGGHVRRADWRADRPSFPEPLLVRDVAAELPIGRTPGHRRVDLVASIAPPLPGAPEPTTVGSVHAVARPMRTAGGISFAPALFVDRVESGDGGAWWFDGVFVRARPPAPGVAALVLRQERRGGITVGGERVVGPDVHGVDRVVTLAAPGPHTVVFAGWEVVVDCPPGVCVQLVETLDDAGCEVSVPRDAPKPRIEPELPAPIQPARWRFPRMPFEVEAFGARVVARPAAEPRRGLDVRISGPVDAAGA